MRSFHGVVLVLVLSTSGMQSAEDPPKPLKSPFTKQEAERARTACAKYLKADETITLEMGKGVKLELVLIPPGTFLMGSPKSEKERSSDEEQHEVALTHPYYLATTESSQEQYQALGFRNPSHFKGEKLPYGTAKKGTSLQKTTPVGDNRYLRNNFGLSDMHGNVGEWCEDFYGEYSDLKSLKDPIQTTKQKGFDLRVLRGGSWGGPAAFNRAAWRGGNSPNIPDRNFGFRVCLRSD